MNEDTIKAILILVLAIVIITPVIGFHRLTEDTVTVTIDNKELVTKHNKPLMMIYTPDEVFTCNDSWAFWHFDSSNVYNKLKPGKTYKARVSGCRWPFFSCYKNIISVTETENQAK